MIEVIAIDGAPVSMAGDYFETLIYCDAPEMVKAYLQEVFDFDAIEWHSGEQPFIEIKAQQFLPDTLCEELRAFQEVKSIKKRAPVLPIMARKNVTIPFYQRNITAQKVGYCIKTPIFGALLRQWMDRLGGHLQWAVRG